MKNFTAGTHSLGFMFTIASEDELRLAMRLSVKNGCFLFEMPYLLCQIAWEVVARIAKEEGITEIALCHFWPIGDKGTALCGDPLGSKAEQEDAVGFINNIIHAAEILREGSIIVRFIDGPSWGGLAKKYDEDWTVLKPRMLEFLKKAGDKCQAAGLILALEFLRPEEDKVIGSTKRMVEVLEALNHPAVKMHFDIFHSVECGEDPAKMIAYASKWIVYLHLHGDKRIAPGAPGDKRDWKHIVKKVNGIQGLRPIPIVVEPFGQKTCADNPDLGAGLPPALPMEEYVPLARKTLIAAGLNI